MTDMSTPKPVPAAPANASAPTAETAPAKTIDDRVRELEEAMKKLSAVATSNTAEASYGARLRRSFQTLWVGGTLGAFFAAVIITIPDAYRELGWPAALGKTLDRSLRYGYMIWLLVYFFVSNLLNEHAQRPRPKDVWFDVGQSAAALAAAWALGFLSPTDTFQRQSIAQGVIWSNGAIACICILSLLLFQKDSDGADKYRGFGLGLTVLTAAAWAPLWSRPVAALAVTAGSWLLLSILLSCYVRDRLRAVKAVGPPLRRLSSSVR